MTTESLVAIVIVTLVLLGLSFYATRPRRDKKDDEKK